MNKELKTFLAMIGIWTIIKVGVVIWLLSEMYKLIGFVNGIILLLIFIIINDWLEIHLFQPIEKRIAKKAPLPKAKEEEKSPKWVKDLKEGAIEGAKDIANPLRGIKL